MISSSDSAVMQCQWNGEVCQKVLSITPVTQPNEIVTVSGKPTGYVNTLTTGIDFSNFYLKYVPTNVFSTFPAFQWLQIYNCSTTSLLTDSFTNCASLVSLAVLYGNIPYVSEGFAQTCGNIERIYLANNNIEVIDKNAFRGLVKLNMVDMKSNKITCVPSDLFQPAPLMQNIFLEKNKIAGIDRNLFRNLKSLLNVYLDDNLIKYLPKLNLAQGNLNPMGISFYRNPIVAINPDFCSTFTNRSLNYVDNINIKMNTDPGNIPCLPVGSTLSQISRFNCISSANVLQSCYANYLPSMPDTIACELNPICIPGSVWYKLLDFLKNLNF